GIGMSEEIRRRCTETHFSTKRDNAVFEGFNAGMGLGLSFVTMVLDLHGASLEIDSRPLGGATFRVTFPVAATRTARVAEDQDHGPRTLDPRRRRVRLPGARRTGAPPRPGCRPLPQGLGVPDSRQWRRVQRRREPGGLFSVARRCRDRDGGL